MKRWGSGDRFREIITEIRSRDPDAAFRSSFIVGFPGETERDHDELLAFLTDVELEWAGFFPFSREDGTPAATMDGVVPDDLMHERLRECAEAQDPITSAARDALIGDDVDVLVDGVDDETREPVGRTHREAPEIDGVVRISNAFARPGARVRARVTSALGPDLIAEPS
jgi:ribosomal protein S12 methylthiotransferase